MDWIHLAEATQKLVHMNMAKTLNPLPPNVIYIYMSYRTANLQTLHFKHFKYFFNKYPY
jgi:hypothetical protein